MITPDMETIDFDRGKLQILKNAYNQARAFKADQFDFQGHTLLTDYAKYLIEYLDMQFGNKN